MNELVGKEFYSGSGRRLKVESAFYSLIEPFYLIRWTDTNEVFCEHVETVNEWFKEGKRANDL